MEFVDKLPKVEIDFEKQKLSVDGFDVKLIRKLTLDGDKISIEKYRVFVPQFKFEEAWENFLGSDVPSEDEAVEDWDKQKSPVFLDRKSRKPLIYRFVIDRENNLYFDGKHPEE